jgi:hypothetical protein
MTAPQPQFTNIHGNQYETVASRLKRFRHTNPHGSIHTDMTVNGDIILCKADVSILVPDYSRINDSGEPPMVLNHLASGYAEEHRGSSQINNTSAVENCETSAIGRALGIAGWDASGTSLATADEVANAIHQQNTQPSQHATVQAHGSKGGSALPIQAPVSQASAGPDGKIKGTYTPTQVEVVELKRKSDGKPFSKYVIHCADATKLTSLRGDFADAANAAINQGSDVEATHLAANRWGDCEIKEMTVCSIEVDAIADEEIPF